MDGDTLEANTPSKLLIPRRIGLAGDLAKRRRAGEAEAGAARLKAIRDIGEREE
jgi:hypothetical protein